jgi:5-methylcytosine-specific restriction endonuclease McrA
VHSADKQREDATRRGYNRRHRKWRMEVLARDLLSRACGAKPATVADHIVPLNQGGTWDLSNGQGLDETCHRRKTAMQSSGWGRR